MNFKKVAFTIELLALTSVMSVGFSAWAIVETTFPTVTATIETENVINNNEYLDIKDILFSDYKYSDTASERCFYPDFDWSVSSRTKAKLFATIDVNLAIWKELVGTTTYSNLVFSLDITTKNVKTWLGTPTASHSYNGSNSISSTVTSTTSGWSENFSISYESIKTLSSISIGLIYTFTLTTTNTEYLINYLNNQKGAGFSVQILAEMSGG